MPERVGFEPTILLTVYKLSKPSLINSRIQIYYATNIKYATAAPTIQIINYLSIVC